MADGEMARCANCLFWESKAPALATALRDPALHDGVGACHYNPPVVIPAGHMGGAHAYFAIVLADRWCGSYRERPEPDDGAREDHPDDVVVPFGDRRAA